mgnify:FL=1
MKYFPTMYALICLFILLTAAAVAARGQSSPYLPMMQSHFDRVLDVGLDRYGTVQSDMWVSSLDVHTGEMPAKEDPYYKRWYREIHAPRGSTLYWDQPLITAAHALSDETGDATYAQAADAYIEDFLAVNISPQTDLFLWGNHIYYNVETDQNRDIGSSYHELRPHAPDWDVFWQIDPDATRNQINAMYRQHVKNKTTGWFDRHGSTTSRLGDNSTIEQGLPFLEAGAVLIESFGWLARKEQQEGNPTAAAEQIDRAKLVANFSYGHRDPVTGLLPTQPANSSRWDYTGATSEVGLWAGALLKTAEYTGDTDFQDIGEQGLRAYLENAWNDNAGLYYGTVHVETGDPVSPSTYYMPRYHAEVFDSYTAPTHSYPLQSAEATLELYELTGDAFYKQAAERWVQHVTNKLSGSRVPGYAGEYGRIINFLLNAAEVLEEPAHRALAEQVAADAVSTLYIEEAGMFRTHGGNKEDRTVATDGLGVLFQALQRVESLPGPPPPPPPLPDGLLLFEGFETDGGPDGAGRYTTDNEFYGGANDLFMETSDADATSISTPLTGQDGDHFFLAEDMDDDGNPDIPTLADPAKLTFSGLGPVVDGELTVALAALNGGWENSGTAEDLFQIVADVDGDGVFEAILQDTNIVGGSIRVNGIALTTTFTDFTFAIPDATDISDDLAIQLRILNGGGEDLGIDNVRVTGELIPEPTTAALIGLGGLVVLAGRRRRTPR